MVQILLTYKLIYVFSIPYATHKGLLKIGEATIRTKLSYSELTPCSHQLNTAARLRIRQYTDTAGIPYNLEYTELAVRKTPDGYLSPFKDLNVHSVLINSNIQRKKPNGETGNEWFAVDLETVKNAIKAVKEGKTSLDSSQIKTPMTQKPIDFRDEQGCIVETN